MSKCELIRLIQRVLKAISPLNDIVNALSEIAAVCHTSSSSSHVIVTVINFIVSFPLFINFFTFCGSVSFALTSCILTPHHLSVTFPLFL